MHKLSAAPKVTTHGGEMQVIAETTHLKLQPANWLETPGGGKWGGGWENLNPNYPPRANLNQNAIRIKLAGRGNL